MPIEVYKFNINEYGFHTCQLKIKVRLFQNQTDMSDMGLVQGVQSAKKVAVNSVPVFPRSLSLQAGAHFSSRLSCHVIR